MIHQYKLNGYNIVLDVCSGSVHVVDDVAFEIIQNYETTPKEELSARILQKYADRADVTESDVSDCFAQIEELIFVHLSNFYICYAKPLKTGKKICIIRIVYCVFTPI
jgi:hypothetical protein